MKKTNVLIMLLRQVFSRNLSIGRSNNWLVNGAKVANSQQTKAGNMMNKIYFLLLMTVASIDASYAVGTAGITGSYQGEYHITMYGCPGICSESSFITLGWGIKDAPWVWDFNDHSAEIEGTMLSVGFPYEVQDLYNSSLDDNIVYFSDNGDGTYTLQHGFQIYNPNVGSPRKESETTFMITQENNKLTIETIDREIDGSLDGVPGTQITDVFPMTIAPEMNGWARCVGCDTTGNGISDLDEIALGLDPDVADTDGDGVDDIDELGDDLENPLDSDGDGVIDALEYGDDAFNSQEAADLPILTEELSGETITLSVTENWNLSELSSDLMVVDIDASTTTEETEFADSTLGAPGLNYIYGQVGFTATASTDETTVSVQVRYSVNLPDDDVLLVYTLELHQDDAEKFTLLPASQWRRIDSTTIEVSITSGSSRDMAVDVDDEIATAIAPVENTLGGVDRGQGGSAGWGLILLLIMALGRAGFIIGRRGRPDAKTLVNCCNEKRGN